MFLTTALQTSKLSIAYDILVLFALYKVIRYFLFLVWPSILKQYLCWGFLFTRNLWGNHFFLGISICLVRFNSSSSYFYLTTCSQCCCSWLLHKFCIWNKRCSSIHKFTFRLSNLRGAWLWLLINFFTLDYILILRIIPILYFRFWDTSNLLYHWRSRSYIWLCCLLIINNTRTSFLSVTRLRPYLT